MLLSSGPAKGAELEPPEVECDGDACAAEISKDQPAPADGIWYSPELAAELQVAAESVDAVRKLERKRADKLVIAEQERAERLVAVEVEAAQRLTAMFERELARATPWFESPAFVAPLVVTAVFVVELVVGLLLAEYSKFLRQILEATP